MSRIAAIDLARFVALAGMFAAHTWDYTATGDTTFIGQLVSGRAAALFAVIAGVGVAFVTRGALARGDRGAAVRMLVARGAVILFIGLMLGFLPTNVFIVIAYYGLLFCVLAPLVLLRTRWLLMLAAVLALAGPVVNAGVRGAMGVDYEIGTPDLFDAADPLLLGRALLLTGIYPVISWTVYGLVGITVGRALLRAAGDGRDPSAPTAIRRLGLRLLAAGGISALAGHATSWIVLDLAGGRSTLGDRVLGGSRIVDLYLDDSGLGAPVSGDPLWLAASSSHTGTTPDLLITIGISLAVVGALLALLPAPGPRARLVLLPALGAGAAPLTVYAVHVTLTAAVPELAAQWLPADERLPFSSSPGLWLAHLAIALLLGTALAVLRIRGPLEVVVTAVGRRAAGRSARTEGPERAASTPPHTGRSAPPA